MKRLIYLILCIVSVQASAQYANGKIKVYFNRPVDDALATTYPAVFLNETWADTLCAYINRAQYSIDVAQYDYTYSSAVVNIANAINAAYTRGVTIRWVKDGSSSNSALSNLNSNIPIVASPTTSAYNIMHDKFVIIDANASNPDLSYVWTGSPDWSQEMVDSDVNNVIIFQDQPLAQAYTAQFNQMWGGPGATPVPANQKFGPYKTDLGPHFFTIGGSTVELYFSPADSTNNHILDAINSANSQLFLGMYDLTEDNDANAIVARKNAGVTTAAILDQYATTGSATAYQILNSGIGTALKIYTDPASYYHNKFLIVDPCDTGSDPLVLTGSHNWTFSADTKNDENTVIIHNADVANIYYQSFYENYTGMLAGSLAACYVSGTCAGAMTATITVNTSPVCYGENTGMATVHVHGAHGPFTYSWDTSPAQADSVLSNVPGGSYMVTITDSNGCQASAALNLPQHTEINVAVTTSNATNSQSNGKATIILLSGGVHPYTISWSNGESGYSDTSLAPATYVVTIQDSMGCQVHDTVTISNVNGIADIDGLTFSLYPNPAHSEVMLDLGNTYAGASFSLKNILGETLLTESISSARTTLDLSPYSDGVYFVEISLNGKKAVRKLSISK